MTTPVAAAAGAPGLPDDPWLDRTGEPWIGVFPGLGEVRVDAHGSVTVRAARDAAETRPAAHDHRAEALRWGWGEPLSLVRRGFLILHGTTLVCPEGDAAVLLAGESHRAADLLPALAAAGWRVLADRITPARVSGGAIVVHPRGGPVLAADRASPPAAFGAPARPGSDARILDVPRAETPVPLAAVVDLLRRREPGASIAPVTGHASFELASGLIASGVMAGGDPASAALAPTETAARMAAHVSLARLPSARLSRDAGDASAAVAALTDWWGQGGRP